MTSPTAPGQLSASAGSRNEQTRRHNLSTVLTLVHHGGSTSRADLTRLTGLNRSTIGALTAELAAARLVYESPAPEAGTVGRPSPLVNPNSDIVAIAINPDIDAIEVAIVSLGGVVVSRVRQATDTIPTPEEATRIAASLVKSLVAGLGEGRIVVGVGAAIPGLVHANNGVVARAPHLDWTDVAWGSQLAEVLGYPVAVGNDASIAVVAVAAFGAGQGSTHLMYLNGSSSGIGGGVMVDGSRLVGADGFAGELGHTLVSSGGEACHCGRRGCLETEVNLSRLYAAARESGIDPAIVLEYLAAPKASALRDEVDRQADMLAFAIANLISVFNPEAVVLGGFLGDLYDAREDRILKGVLADAFAPLADHVRIDRAKLGDNLLMVGAAELAFTPLLHDPAGWFAGT